MSTEINYRKAAYASTSDTDAINALYRRIFNVDMTKTLRYWYGNNPAGHPYGIVACDGDKIAGHFGTMSIRVRVGDRSVKGRISMGFMVDGDYRGHGIARTISEKLFDDLRDMGEDEFVIGFPNDVSYQMHIERMGYELIRHFSFVDLPRTAPCEGFEKIKDVSGFEAALKDDPPEAAIGETDPANDMNRIAHTRDWLLWRYADAKYDKYISPNGGLFVSTRFRDKADILYWSEGASNDELLGFASFLHRTDGTERVCTWNTCDQLNDYPMEDRQYHMTMNIITDDDAKRDALRRKWLFYMGDCELF